MNCWSTLRRKHSTKKFEEFKITYEDEHDVLNYMTSRWARIELQRRGMWPRYNRPNEHGMSTPQILLEDHGIISITHYCGKNKVDRRLDILVFALIGKLLSSFTLELEWKVKENILLVDESSRMHAWSFKSNKHMSLELEVWDFKQSYNI